MVLPDPSKVKSDSHLKQGLIVKEAVTCDKSFVLPFFPGKDDKTKHWREFNVIQIHDPEEDLRANIAAVHFISGSETNEREDYKIPGNNVTPG